MMKIAIATTGRFHVLDLARELAALGHDVLFYSVLPKRRVLRFGLAPEAHRSYLPWLMPLLVAQRYGGRGIGLTVNPWILQAADRIIARRLEACDIFIGMSGLCIESARVARERFGAKVYIERGSRHILSQKEILDDIRRMSPSADSVPDDAVRRELETYDLADVIVVPSRHVANSFIERGYGEDRLFRNPYGVDLAMFPPTLAPVGIPPTVIYVGAWSYQKGCDLLTAAVTRFSGSVRLLHVGAVADAPLPKEPWFQHQDAVPQWQLRDWYGQAHVFALASRQEGLSLVQAQALACGLPVVCTDRTGGEDLRDLIPNGDNCISIVPYDDIDALEKTIKCILQRSRLIGDTRDLLGDHRHLLSWACYGRRYSEELSRRL